MGLGLDSESEMTSTTHFITWETARQAVAGMNIELIPGGARATFPGGQKSIYVVCKKPRGPPLLP